MRTDRRQFLLASAALLAMSGCRRASAPPPLPLTGDNVFLGGGRYRESAQDAAREVLSVIEVDAAGRAQRHVTTTAFLPHGVHAHPHTPHRLALFEKKGPGACEYDLHTQQVIRPIPVAANRRFYGHGSYTADGEHLLSTEASVDTLDGAIGIREASSLRELGTFPSYGKAPHECQLIDEGRTLVVTNGGGPLGGDAPCVTYIDVASQRLLERVPLHEARLNTGHFGIARDRSLVVVSAPRAGLENGGRGGVSLRSPGESALHTLSDPPAVVQEMLGEALSVSIQDERGVVAVTHPDGNLVTFWSLRDRALLKTLRVTKPRGVTLTRDHRAFIVSAGDQASLLRVPVDTLEPDAQPLIALSFMTGSHLYNWKAGMRELLSPGPMG